MKRVTKFGIRTNGTIRYVGNNERSIRNRYERSCDTLKTSKIHQCLFCGGKKYSCKALGGPDGNKYSIKHYTPKGKKHVKKNYRDIVLK